MKNGFEAIVDIDDFDRLSKLTWHMAKTTNSKIGYVTYTINNYDEIKRTCQSIRMHRLVMNVTDPKIQVDHINNNPLDNRKCNLRLCNAAQNARNTKFRSTNTTGYKGVFLQKRSGRYTSSIGVNKERYYLGIYNTPEQAALAYNEASRKYHGEYGYINKITN
jgi:hypothetical protein